MSIGDYEAAGTRRYTLIVDLPSRMYGIYNSDGKRFMEKYFKNDVLPPNTSNPEELKQFFNQNHPSPPRLRWASAGVLPIVHWNDRDWFVLILRTRSPFGLNVANGGSENDIELGEVESLGLREFEEEIVWVQGFQNSVGALGERDSIPRLVQRRYRLSLPPNLPRLEREKIEGMEFVLEHNRRRKEDCDFRVEIEQGKGAKVERVKTNMEVKVYSAGGEPTYLSDVIFSINPRERGIEVIQLLKFDMDPDDFLLFGELGEVRGSPLGNPIVLGSYDFLMEEFRREKQEKGSSALSDPVEAPPYHGGRYLKETPSNAFFVFPQDTALRMKRVSKLQEELKKRFERACTWERLPGEDGDRLLRFVFGKLRDRKLAWVLRATLSKTSDRIEGKGESPGETLSLSLAGDRAFLELQGVGRLTFFVAPENGKKILYYDREWDDHVRFVTNYLPAIEALEAAQKASGGGTLRYSDFEENVRTHWPFYFCPVTWKTIETFANQ